DLIYDVSDRIRIAAAGILVASPSTNNVLKRGSEYTISWTLTGAQNANVKLRVFQGAVQILNITDSTPNDGSYTWTVPADMTMGNDLVIRVKAIDNLVSDDSGLLTIED
ncbi:MAG: Ser-Thr-rich GPI-anchored membrane family protein, partial [Acidobacteriota bacterium]